MTAINANSTGVAPGSPAMVAEITSAAERTRRALRPRDTSAHRSEFRPSGTLFSPTAALPWLLGSLGVAACIAPWLARGWLWFDVIAAAAAVVAGCDAFALWFTRKEFAPVLLSSKEGLRGREGQSIQIPLALAGSGRRRLRSEVQLAIMAATRESEMAIRVKAAQRLRLERPEWLGPARLSQQRARSPLALDAGGRVAPPRAVACTARGNRVAVALRDLALTSMVRFACAAAGRCGFVAGAAASLAQPNLSRAGGRAGNSLDRARARFRALAGISTRRQLHGNRLEIHGATRRAGYEAVPVGTKAGSIFRGRPIAGFRVGNRSGTAIGRRDPSGTRAAAAAGSGRRNSAGGRDGGVGTGRRIGLVTYAEEPKSWLRAGSGQFQFSQFRDRLLSLEPLPTTADYEALFSKIRLQLRRRAYLVLLADLAERSISDSMRRGVALLRTSHVVLMTSVLPAYARPAFSPGEQLRTDWTYSRLRPEKRKTSASQRSRVNCANWARNCGLSRPRNFCERPWKVISKVSGSSG